MKHCKSKYQKIRKMQNVLVEFRWLGNSTKLFCFTEICWRCICHSHRNSYGNFIIFFEELIKSLWMALNTYDNIIVMGNFNIDVNKDEGIGHKLGVFCCTLNLTNLVKSDKCYTNNHNNWPILKNKPRSFQFAIATKTDLSDYHGIITTFMKPHFSRLKPKIIHYLDFKRFDAQKFIADVKNADFSKSKWS